MDKYDKAIEHLNAHPDEILSAWGAAYPDHPTGCLFQYASPSEEAEFQANRMCGCLTQVRGDDMNAWTPKLTAEIRADKRIPLDVDDVTVADLPVFAEWQRRLDRELQRT